MENNFLAKELSPERWNDLVAFFEYKGSCSGCWCMNHRLSPDREIEGEAAKQAMKQLVLAGRAFGVLAFVPDDPTPVGWCALDKRKTLPGHDCVLDETDCADSHWSIHCVAARLDFKGQGVEGFLTTEALLLAKRLEASYVEAYPEPGSTPGQEFRTWNTFSGHQSCYEGLGFKVLDRDNQSSSEFYQLMTWKR